MSRRCTLTVSSLLICVGVTAACGSLPSGTQGQAHPTTTAADTLLELRASYEALAAQLDVALCRFTAVVESSSASMQALQLAATDMANSSSSVTNHLALLPWRGKLQAHSQTLIRAIAAVETELRRAATRTTASATMKHIQAARVLIARIPLAGTQLRADIHAADKSACR